MKGWQPIETAPKDKGYLIGWVEGTVRFIQWGKTSHVPMYGWNLADQGVEEFDLCHPTYWMPLPAAPSATPNEKASMGEGERAEFEGYLLDHVKTHPDFAGMVVRDWITDRYTSGRYVMGWVQSQWEGWQAHALREKTE